MKAWTAKYNPHKDLKSQYNILASSIDFKSKLKVKIINIMYKHYQDQEISARKHSAHRALLLIFFLHCAIFSHSMLNGFIHV